jgi:hypothetical protein
MDESRCLTTDEYTNKICYKYTIEYYSATKKNEIMSFVGKWVEMKIIMLTKISQTQKDKYYVFSHT